MKALSIRQPWAWLIVNGHKDIENRSWTTKVRGTVAVHASKGVIRKDYDAAAQTIAIHSLDITLPRFEELERGGIIGTIDITGCVPISASPWFIGPNGFQLVNPRPLPFVQLTGKLGFFNAPDTVSMHKENSVKGGA